MGRKSVKENKSIYQQTREELGLTREKAAELVPGFSPERLEKIENGRTQVQPDDVMLLAEYYKTPFLCNYYCVNECPIGQVHALRPEPKELGQIAVETFNAQHRLNNQIPVCFLRLVKGTGARQDQVIHPGSQQIHRQIG